MITDKYLSMRKVIGFIGILLPFVLMLGNYLIFGAGLPDSISHFYWTGMRDVFVGAICATALFMFFYDGYEKIDDITGDITAISALGLAWFPTTQVPPLNWIGYFHLSFAIVFFLSLSFFSLFLFTKSNGNPTPQKKNRNNVYITCGVIMLLCLLTTIITIITGHNHDTSIVLWSETIALVAFGVSWLVKGEYILKD